MNVIKYLKVLLYILIPVLIFNIITTLLYYFNLIGSNVTNYLKLIMIVLSMLTGGVYIGSKATKKGWLEGIKVGLEVIILLFLIVAHLNFNQNYFKAITRGKYTLKRTINLIINIGLIISLFVTIISGIFISQIIKTYKNRKY